MAKGIAATLSGDITVPITIAANTSLDHLLTGSVTVPVAVAATLVAQYNESIVGSVSVPITVTSGMAAAFANIISGSIAVPITVAATTQYNLHASITGAVTVPITITAGLATSSGNEIVGSIAVPITVASTLVFNKHASITSNILVRVLPISGSVLDNSIAYARALSYSDEGVWLDESGNAHHAQFGSANIAFIGPDDTDTQALYLPGPIQNYASTPDAAALDITGDIDIQVLAALDDWTPSVTTTLLSKYLTSSTPDHLAYKLRVDTLGRVALDWSEDGTTSKGESASTATGLSDGEKQWIRVTLDVDDGAGDATVTFYLGGSADTPSWSQLGTPVKVGSTTSIAAETATLEVGSYNNGVTHVAAGKFYRAIVKDGIDGTTVFDADFTAEATGTTSFTESSSNAAMVTVNQSGADTNDPLFLSPDGYVSYSEPGTQYLYLPGSTGNYASTPDAAPLHITGDIDIAVRVALDQWPPPSFSTVISRYKTAGGSDLSWRMSVQAGTNKLSFIWSYDGTNTSSGLSTAGVSASDGDVLWIRATLDVDNDSGGYDLKFYTGGSGDTPSWSQLGNTVTGGATTVINAGTVDLQLGGYNSGATAPAVGKYFNAIVKDGIDGTTVFDADFTDRSNVVEPFATFTEDSSNAATVTINRSSSGRKSSVVDYPLFLLGTDDYFEIADHADLNFGANDSFTLMVLMRDYGAVAYHAYICKRTNVATASVGYLLYRGAADIVKLEISDGTTEDADSGVDLTGVTGLLTALAGVRDTGADTLEVFNDATSAGPSTDDTTGTLTNTNDLYVGALADASAYYVEGEIFAYTIWRSALNDSVQVAAIQELLGARVLGLLANFNESITGSVNVPVTIASTMDATFHESITGTVTVPITIASGMLASVAEATIIGAVTVSITIASGMIASIAGAELVGDVTILVTVASTMQAAYNESIVGAITVPITISAALDFTLNASIAGSIDVPLNITAITTYNTHPTIFGSVGVDITPAANMLSSFGRAVIGAITVPITILANTGVGRTIAGGVDLPINIASTMQYNSNRSIIGSTDLALTITAAMVANKNPSLIGNITVPINIAASLDSSAKFLLTTVYHTLYLETNPTFNTYVKTRYETSG
jgi:hypothetical protein